MKKHRFPPPLSTLLFLARRQVFAGPQFYQLSFWGLFSICKLKKWFEHQFLSRWCYHIGRSNWYNGIHEPPLIHSSSKKTFKKVFITFLPPSIKFCGQCSFSTGTQTEKKTINIAFQKWKPRCLLWYIKMHDLRMQVVVITNLLSFNVSNKSSCSFNSTNRQKLQWSAKEVSHSWMYYFLNGIKPRPCKLKTFVLVIN